jgi:hypothetical protein
VSLYKNYKGRIVYCFKAWLIKILVRVGEEDKRADRFLEKEGGKYYDIFRKKKEWNCVEFSRHPLLWY